MSTAKHAPTLPGKIEFNMTPMIDVVFQLMAFFLMTFKVAAVEGDFQLRLPNESRFGGSPVENIVVRLAARPDGELDFVQLARERPYFGGSNPGAFLDIRRRIETLTNAARQAGQDPPTVEIDADDKLRYEYVVRAIEATTTTHDDDGSLVPSGTKIRFTPKPVAN